MREMKQVSDSSPPVANRQKIEQAIAALEAQRALLGDEVVDTAISSLRKEVQESAEETAPQRKQATVLFADLVGFTALAGAMDAEDVVELVNTLWERLDGIILAHGGGIDKHVGDGVMALFGAPVAQEDDPERAVLAGLAMQAGLRDWVNGQAVSVSPTVAFPFHNLQMRIGINTGSVLFGAVGSTGEITAMGDTVNIASRLEGAAPVGGVLIAEETWRQVMGRFDAKPLSVRLKGRDELFTAYVVEGEKSAARRTSGRGVAGIETRTVGREVESEQLRAIFAQVVEQQQARIVTVLGEAGVGKSRLLQEFSAWLHKQPQAVFFLAARATADSQRIPYQLVGECIASKLQITNSTPGPLARERLITGLADVGGDDPGMAEFIGHLIGLDFSGSTRIQNVLGDAQQIRSRSFQYLARFFTAVCQEQPAVVLLDDIHWADSGSLDVIQYLGQECAQIPLLIICLARPSLLERRTNWGNNLLSSSILPLEPLSPEQSGALVGEILRHVQEIPAELMRTITEAAGGNAFYIEELIKVLIEDGVIVRDTGTWRVQTERLGQLRVPPTLTAVLQARLDRLPKRERDLLQRASVVGRVFWDNALHFVHNAGQTAQETDSTRQDEAALLSALVQGEFIQQSRKSAFEGATEYHFRHAILHEVAYESVLLRRRHLYHQRVAEWLLQVGQDRVSESAGLIGEHFARAGRAADASHWFAKAGHRARETYLPEVAIEYYAKALGHQREDRVPEDEVPENVAQHKSLYYHLGEMLFWQARYDEAVTAFQAADRLAEQAGDIGGRSQAWNQLSLVYGRKGAHQNATDSAEQAAAFARKAALVQELIQALLTKASSLLVTGNAEDAQTLCDEALSLSQQADLKVEIAQANNLLGRICDAHGAYAQSMQYKEKALDTFRSLDDRRRTGWVLHNMGVVVLLQGDYRAAANVFQDALQIATEIGDRDWQMAVLTNLGSVYVGLEEFSKAVETLENLLKITHGTDFYFTALVHSTLAEALLGLGRVCEASNAAEQGLNSAEMEKVLEYLGYAWRVRGQICAQSSCPWTADEYFAKSVDLFISIGAEAERARSLREWAIYLCRIDEMAMSISKWEESRSIFQRLDMGLEVRRLDELFTEWKDQSTRFSTV